MSPWLPPPGYSVVRVIRETRGVQAIAERRERLCRYWSATLISVISAFERPGFSVRR